jgi:hypothetical protein
LIFWAFRWAVNIPEFYSDTKDNSQIVIQLVGAILQQLLLLPVHPKRPTSLPFKVRHALLTGTLASPLEQPFVPVPSNAKFPPPGQKMTEEQKLEMARPFTEASLGPAWVADLRNKDRLRLWLERAIHGRCMLIKYFEVAKAEADLDFLF